ncbi:MAG: protein kinase [Planctomycetes bacterium]|nr:protein kinase [Planctomycetota bacterium]
MVMWVAFSSYICHRFTANLTRCPAGFADHRGLPMRGTHRIDKNESLHIDSLMPCASVMRTCEQRPAVSHCGPFDTFSIPRGSRYHTPFAPAHSPLNETCVSRKSYDKLPRVESFDLRPGRKIGSRYEVVALLGKGTEGEVYQIQEVGTGIHRAAKLYFPHRNPDNRSTIWYARKINALRHCPIVLQYHHTEMLTVRKHKVLCLVSDLARGMQLEQWIAQHRGKRLTPFRALHVLYQLVRGLEAVHAVGEYHADVHSQNILIEPIGVSFNIKLVDFYNWGKPTRYKQRQDIMDCVTVFHECLGGREHYHRQPPETRAICMGLQRSKVLKKFPTIITLRRHLESFEWTTLL